MQGMYMLIANITSKSDPMEILSDTSISNNVEIRSMFSSVSGLLFISGVAGVVIALMVNGIIYMWGKKNPEKIAEFKEMVAMKLLLLAGLSGFTSFCALIKMIADYVTNGESAFL